ncbi:hypothetical protein A8C56_20855 [Niabella ginsenosidivorans]|uniref:Uncharacterized protein n=1 Tax=Niabella ginsenosidivorans TaxID=1176587 RepID=A0A1A9I6A4_9BACT|nr:DUF4407 domain-containing protein [Niabella ginsenosidivorans]ANH83103.1 hypothetical protein A8C56_20855 [Niabella ginsenosidivorans]
MNQAIHNLRLLFCSFSGEDDFIIRKCSTGIQIRFALIGAFVLLIFVGCWLSAGLFVSHIFDNARWISIPVAVVWAFLVTLLYLLLLYTISPALLPVAQKKTIIQNGKKKKIIIEEKKKEKRLLLSFSFLFRLGLITFLAVVVAQPVNVWIFSHNYEEGDRFAEILKSILNNQPLSWMLTVFVCSILLLPVYFKYGIRKISVKSFRDDFESRDTEKGLRHLREQLGGNITDFDNLSKQILSVNINSIRTADFYFQKSLIEYRIILEEYEQFKKEYTIRLVERNRHYNRTCWENLMPHLNRLENINPEKYQLLYAQLENDLQVQESAFEKYEYWADHPFRTKYKTATRKLTAETELLRTFYQENNE